MATLDLNARRAARSEAENTPHELTLGHDKDGNPLVFKLKPRMPVEYMDLLQADRGGAALQLLLVDPDQWELLRGAEPDVGELEAITRLYTMSSGESAGSPRFSTNGGPNSNAPSRPTTDSILPVSAGERALLASDGSSP
ncbi:MAG TPA: hypothetical protein VG276_27870 [Actinomycetes bacterium]|jgi:hypothetical protein|nr:hypothetical protein [Actinomycetes bacterium]